MNPNNEEKIEKILEYLTDSETKGMKKLVLGLLAANLILLSGLLIITASNYGPLYEMLKPDMYQENYQLDGQYIGDIHGYENILIFKVHELDDNMQPVEPGTLLYFADEHKTKKDLSDGDIITVTWVKQKLDKPYINGVSKYYEDEKLNLKMNL